MPRRLHILLAILALLAATPTIAQPDLEFTQIADLGDVVDIRNAGDGSGRLFLVEQAGRIQVFSDGAVLETPFLDISDRVLAGGERGLLSAAFAPDYPQSAHFYAWYTNNDGDAVLSRFAVSNDPDVADAASEQVLLEIAQPASNHNGGRLQFGPDGMLYLGTGDGGGAGDPDNNAQTLATLLGKLLRLDVDPAHGTYAAPPDNPFTGDPGARDEIWAYGLRNPWRIAFDRHTGDLWIADVGQSDFEEINVQSAYSEGGENYGWRIMEGTSCYDAQSCDMTGLTLPVFEYGHDQGCSVAGGEVYRGAAYPQLYGTYLLGDYCSGRVWGITPDGDGWAGELLRDTTFSITTFGLGEDGSLYLASEDDGVYLVSDGTVVPEPSFTINAGLNDSWFNPDTGGQGFFVTVFPDIGMMFLAWFTYEVERPPQDVTAMLGDPGHRWLTAFGPYSGDTAMLDIEITTGGVFDAAEPDPTQQPDGTIEVEFTDCERGTVRYRVESLDLEGWVPIQRLADDNVAQCEEL